MTIGTSRSELLARATIGSGFTDDVIVNEFETYKVSYNAEAAFCGLLGAACEIAIQRPQLMERLLPTVMDPAHAMGVDSADKLIEYAKILIERDISKDPEYRQFSQGGIFYFHQFMSGHLTAMQHVLDKLNAPVRYTCNRV
jgi:hypothetical protein